jgi:hypothetical protein
MAYGLLLRNRDHDMIIRPPGGGVRSQHAELHALGELLVTSHPSAHAEPGLLTTGRSGLDMSRMLMPDLPDSMLRRMFGEMTYTEADERWAEVFATMLGGRLAPFEERRWYRTPGRRSPAQVRLADAFLASTPPSLTT